MPGLIGDLDLEATARRLAHCSRTSPASKQPPHRPPPSVKGQLKTDEVHDESLEKAGANRAVPSPCAAPPPRALAQPTPPSTSLLRGTGGAPLPPPKTHGPVAPRCDQRRLPHETLVVPSPCHAPTPTPTYCFAPAFFFCVQGVVSLPETLCQALIGSLMSKPTDQYVLESLAIFEASSQKETDIIQTVLMMLPEGPGSTLHREESSNGDDANIHTYSILATRDNGDESGTPFRILCFDVGTELMKFGSISTQDLYGLSYQCQHLKELNIGVFEGDVIRVNSESLEILTIWRCTLRKVAVQHAVKLRRVSAGALPTKPALRGGIWIEGEQRNDEPYQFECLDAKLDEWSAKFDGLHCLKLHLQVFMIKDYKGGHIELAMSSAILEHASNLQQLILQADSFQNDSIFNGANTDLVKVVPASTTVVIKCEIGISVD
ncbi:hypothetical protein HU200_050746 [Digitaria exilis]|uniref:FBD domain-containing protein n=1 Tax=Digitaria exilis TaxID=1010633 RepID=A0A835AWS4_9POAL|nr:hypothetical protein HU200_050746 [Digitaria exilis]